MTENERITLQEHKDFYESEWQKEQLLRIEERQKRLELESSLEKLRLEHHSLKLQAAQASRIPTLEMESGHLRSELELLKSKIAELDNLELLKNSLLEAQIQLKKLQNRVSREGFWHSIALEFAESVDDFPAIYGHEHQAPKEAVQTAVTHWQLEIQDCLEQAYQGKNPDLVQARRFLIAQWVLLRWLEITEVTQ